LKEESNEPTNARNRKRGKRRTAEMAFERKRVGRRMAGPAGAKAQAKKRTGRVNELEKAVREKINS